MNQPRVAPQQVPIRVAVLATAVAAAFLGCGTALNRAVLASDVPSWGGWAIEVVEMLGVLAIPLIGFRALTGRHPTPADLGITGSDAPRERPPDRRRAGSTTVVVLGLVGVVVVLALAGPHMSPALLLATTLVWWPISVLAQQTLFFGWLQPRLGSHGPRTAALLYVAMHVFHPLQVLLVIPLAFLFAKLRRETGSIRAGMVVHYLGFVAVTVVFGGL